MRLLEHRPVIHEGIVPRTGIRTIERPLHQVQYLSIRHPVPSLKEMVDEYRPDVRLHEGMRRREREGGHRGGGGPADARQRDELVDPGRERAAVIRDDATRRPFEVQRTPVVPEAAPRTEHVAEGGISERLEIGESRDERAVLFKHAWHLRLLEHVLRNEDSVRITCMPPGKITSPVPPVIIVYFSSKPLDLRLVQAPHAVLSFDDPPVGGVMVISRSRPPQSSLPDREVPT